MTIKELYDIILIHINKSPWNLHLRQREENIIKVIDYYVYFATIEPYFNREIENLEIYCDVEDEVCFDIILKKKDCND